jgi:hypothetical protein
MGATRVENIITFRKSKYDKSTSRDVFADSAYRSAETEATLKARGFKSGIHVRAARSHPLSKTEVMFDHCANGQQPQVGIASLNMILCPQSS